MKSALNVAELKEYLDEVDHDIIAGATNFYEFLGHMVERLQEAEALEVGMKHRLDELKQRKDRYAKRQESLRSSIQKAMEIAGETKAELPAATISMRAVKPSVIILDEDNIPDSFVKMKRVPDKTAIGAALSNGFLVNGATMSNGGQTISIRVK